MALPEASDPMWRKLISKETDYAFEFLATKLIVGRLFLQYKLSPSEETMRIAIAELRTFFEKNKNLPRVIADLKKVFGEGVKI